MPTARLSKDTIKVKRKRLFSEIETYEKNKFVIKTKKAPTIKDLNTPNVFMNMPPKKHQLWKK